VYTTVLIQWDADFRCFWVTLSCLATSVFVEKKPKKPKKPKNLNFFLKKPRFFPALITGSYVAFGLEKGYG